MLEFRGPFGTSEAFLGPLGPYVRNTSDRGCAPAQILQDFQPLRHNKTIISILEVILVFKMYICLGKSG